jgi:transposase
MNEGLFLKDNDRKILLEMHLSSLDKSTADKIKAVILLDKGWTYRQVSEALLVDERTIYRYREKYDEKGIEGLIENNYKGSSIRLSKEEQELLINELNARLYSNAKEICQFVKKKFNKEYTPNGIVPLLKKLGFSYKKTKAVPAKADKDLQEKFILHYKSLRKRLKPREKIYFSDAVHPTYNMMPDYAWIARGQDRFIKSNSGRQRINILGAYSPNDKSRIILSCKTIDQNNIVRLLKVIEKRNKRCTKLYLYLDNARCNHSKIVKEYLKTSKIKIKYLPSYSPNLNLIERLWKLLKKISVGNKYYETFEEFKKACISTLRRNDPNFIQMLNSLMTENFQRFS